MMENYEKKLRNSLPVFLIYGLEFYKTVELYRDVNYTAGVL